MSKEMQTNDIVLGKDYSSAKRWIAFFSIALIYFFYCFNFMGLERRLLMHPRHCSSAQTLQEIPSASTGFLPSLGFAFFRLPESGRIIWF